MKYVPCPECAGEGGFDLYEPDEFGDEWEMCEACWGTGEANETPTDPGERQERLGEEKDASDG